MKVWVVTYSGDESDGYVIEGVFSTQWRAQRFVEAQGMAVGDRYGIESWEIDEGVTE